MTPEQLAASLIADVKRRVIEEGGDMLYHGRRTTYLPEADVLAALARAMGPDDLVDRLLTCVRGLRSHYPEGAVELIPSYTMEEAAARIAAQQEQLREMALDVLAASGQAQEAYEAQIAAETALAAMTKERDELREELLDLNRQSLSKQAELQRELTALRDRLARMEGLKAERDDAVIKRAAWELAAKNHAEWQNQREAELAAEREVALKEAAEIAMAVAGSCAGNVSVYSPPMAGANEQLRLLHEGGEAVALQIAEAILRALEQEGRDG